MVTTVSLPTQRLATHEFGSIDGRAAPPDDLGTPVKQPGCSQQPGC
jgi:hypothetical protein